MDRIKRRRPYKVSGRVKLHVNKERDADYVPVKGDRVFVYWDDEMAGEVKVAGPEQSEVLFDDKRTRYIVNGHLRPLKRERRKNG